MRTIYRLYINLRKVIDMGTTTPDVSPYLVELVKDTDPTPSFTDDRRNLSEDYRHVRRDLRNAMNQYTAQS